MSAPGPADLQLLSLPRLAAAGNTSLAVLSPLYPVQPDYIYKYDFFSDSPPPQDVSLHIEDINLQRVMTVICDSDVIKLDPSWTL